jgi:hypothetical protein
MNVYNKEDCIIRKAYCGNHNAPPADTREKKYSRVGTRSECLKKGFGAGLAQERSKGLRRTSLQNIDYIGPVYDANFRQRGVATLARLLTVLRPLPNPQKRAFLERGCTKKNGAIDQKAVNALIIYLHDNGLDVPVCQVVRE